MRISYRCDDEINKLLDCESEREELTKNGLIDNIIRAYFSRPPENKNVISERRIRNRNRMRNAETIKAFRDIIDKYDELLEYMDRIFDTRWASSEESEEFRKIVIMLIINIARSLEYIKKELKK